MTSTTDWKDDVSLQSGWQRLESEPKKNAERFPKWLAFIGMTPTEQIQKRFKDLQSQNPKERGFFEDKVVDFKNALVTQDFKPASIHCIITPMQSFFSAHRVGLRFKRGELDVDARAEDKVVKEWISDNGQVKQIYQHGSFQTLYFSGKTVNPLTYTSLSVLTVELL